MRVRITNFQPVENEWVRDVRVLARFTAQLDHFRLFDLKLMDDPERGVTVWATRNVRLSMEGRAEILRKALLRMERPE